MKLMKFCPGDSNAIIRSRATAAILVLFVLSATPAEAQTQYSWTPIGCSNAQPFGPYALGSALNNAGQVTGYLVGSRSSEPRVMLWQNGVVQDITPRNLPGILGGTGHAINNVGHVAARINLIAYAELMRQAAYLIEPGGQAERVGPQLSIPTQFTTAISVTGINSAGHVVGNYGLTTDRARRRGPDGAKILTRPRLWLCPGMGI